MLVATVGGWEPHYGPRGINGPMDDLLFPIQHGILYCPGFEVLPPFVVYRAGRVDGTSFPGIRDALGRRLDALWKTAPIAFRRQNAGDYSIPDMTLRPGLAVDRAGFAVHVAQAADAPAARGGQGTRLMPG